MKRIEKSPASMGHDSLVINDIEPTKGSGIVVQIQSLQFNKELGRMKGKEEVDRSELTNQP